MELSYIHDFVHEIIQSLKKIIFIAGLLFVPVWVLVAQQTGSYRVLLDDQQVPKVVRDSFKSRYPQTFLSLWYTSHITYWYEDYAQTWLWCMVSNQTNRCS